MTDLEQAFAEFELTDLEALPNGDYRWGVWLIIPMPGGGYYAMDDAAPLDETGPWPLRDMGPYDADEIAFELSECGAKPLTADGYAAKQAEVKAMLEWRHDQAKRDQMRLLNGEVLS